MNYAPDVDLRHIKIPGTEPVWFQPFCLRCDWSADALYRTRTLALTAAGVHLKMSCLADSGGGDGTSELPSPEGS